jgi:outer membrane receptor protein involved in Fe transport
VTVRAGAEVTQDFTLVIDPLGMEAIVVTATRAPRPKLESSTAITTISIAQIQREQPRSTADLVKVVPGFYSESSGGEVNNNLWVRGMPQPGSYKFVTIMENGMAANDGNDFSFLGADNFVRTDANTRTVEAVRGGTSALFGSNAPGGLVNFIDKTGGPELAGTLEGVVGTDGYNRYDFNVNGPLAEDWRFSVGGFYRFDDGVRDPGFPASRGGQIKANVQRLFDRGTITVYGKYINDSNLFALNTPMIAEDKGDGTIEVTDEFVEGFPEDGTMTTVDANFTRIPLPRGNGDFILPLEDGVRSIGGSVLADLDFTFANDWNIRNTVRVMWFDHVNNAMPPARPEDADDVIQGFVAETPGAASGQLVFTDTGQPFNTPNNLVSNSLLWHVERPVSNFSNQFMVNKRAVLGETVHNLTAGTYFGHYTADNLWMFNFVFTNVQNAPRLLDLFILDAAGDTIRRVTENGFTNYLFGGDGFRNGFGNATLFAFFVGDEIQFTERLRIDVGGRFERDEYEQNVETTREFDLTAERDVPDTDADDRVRWGTGAFTRVDPDFNEWAASVGINYLLNEQVSLYGRGSRGYRMPFLDQFLTDPSFPEESETVWQAEAGVKVSSPVLGLSAVGFFTRLEDFPSQDLVVDPETGEAVFRSVLVGAAETFGAEIEAIVAPAPGLQLNGIATLQNPEYKDFIQTRGTPPVADTLDGNQVRRVPEVIGRLGADYTYRGFSVGGTWIYFGDRFSDTFNRIELPGYSYFNARVSYTFPDQGVTIFGAGNNIFDGTGLTEGDPRADESGIPQGGITNARPILPARWQVGVRYNF